MILIKKKKIQKTLLQEEQKTYQDKWYKWYKNPPSPDSMHPQISKRNTNEPPPPPSPLASNEGKSLNRSVSGKLSGPIESKGRRIVEPINRETVAFVPPL